MTENLYDVLGIPSTATHEEIRKAYRRLAVQNHPDRNPSPEAQEIFRRITKAYEVVGDPERRGLYDRYGDIALNPNFKGFEQSSDSQFGGFTDFFSGFNSSTTHGTRPYEGSDGFHQRGTSSDAWSNTQGTQSGSSWQDEQFETFSFGTGGRTQNRRSTDTGGGYTPPQKGSDIPVTVSITLVESLQGCSKQVRVARQSRWKRGSNAGVHQEVVTIDIPLGTESDEQIRLREKGNYGQGGGSAGDLVVTVEVQAHPYISRVGPDLYIRVPLTWLEALNGAKVQVPLLSGTVTIQTPASAISGQKLRLKNRGLQRKSGGQGDVYLVLDPQIPSGNTLTTQHLAEQMDSLYPPQGVRGDFRLD